jgi:hypothetical protein
MYVERFGDERLVNAALLGMLEGDAIIVRYVPVKEATEAAKS